MDWLFWGMIVIARAICQRRGHKVVESTISAGGPYCERCWDGNLIGRGL